MIWWPYALGIALAALGLGLTVANEVHVARRRRDAVRPAGVQRAPEVGRRGLKSSAASGPSDVDWDDWFDPANTLEARVRARHGDNA